MPKPKNTISWTLAIIEETFALKGLESEIEMPLLSEWLASPNCQLTESENIQLEKLRISLANNHEDWEEEDLKMNFIAGLLDISGYLRTSGQYRTYFEKSISVYIDKYHLSSKPDMMLAKGVRNELRLPYFCFHEYKKSKPDKDPRGQLVLDMLIAQTMNHNEKPVYGAYIIGKWWQFVILKEKEYKISYSFDATQQDELLRIVAILRHFWTILLTKLV